LFQRNDQLVRKSINRRTVQTQFPYRTVIDGVYHSMPSHAIASAERVSQERRGDDAIAARESA
jgi:hypothetical protein